MGLFSSLLAAFKPQPLISPLHPGYSVPGRNVNLTTDQILRNAVLPSPSPIKPKNRKLSSIDEFKNIALPIFKRYEIPPSVGMGQFAAEGRLGGLGASRNNFYNISAYSSNPNAAQSYNTPEEGVEAYAKLLSGKYELDHIGSGKFDTRYLPAYQLRKDPKAMIRKIHQLGYASRPDYAEFVMSTPEWQEFIKEVLAQR